MGYFASKVKMSYEMASAIPVDNPKYIEYQNFKKMFGEDGSMLAVGFDSKNVFEPAFFAAFSQWQQNIKQLSGVENMLSVPTAINIVKQEGDSSTKLLTRTIFEGPNFDSNVHEFLNLPFYRNLLYNPETNSYLTAIYIKKDVLFSEKRVKLQLQFL